MLRLQPPNCRTPECLGAESRLAWFCLRSQPKHEHIAASQLRRLGQIEVFNPRIRFPRPTRHGAVLVTEAMFPSYLFARFDWTTSLARVHYAPGVSGVVHFGSRWPTVPVTVIEEIRALLGAEEVHVVARDIAPGDHVEIAGGSFHGLGAVITQVLPGRQRVMVLMEFLGRQATVELKAASVIRHGIRR